MKIISLSAPVNIKNQAISLNSSKSESNRVLIINALGEENARIKNLSQARDTQTLIRLLNSTKPELDVLDAGTTMRFLTAYLSLKGDGHVLTGTERMKQRPIRLLVEALTAIGARIEYLEKEGFPPLRIYAIKDQKIDTISIPGNVSSQYISALLMIAPCLEMGLTIKLTEEIFSLPYIKMTLSLMKHFGVDHSWLDERTIIVQPQKYKSAEYTVEADWSGASYWYSIVALSNDVEITLKGLSEKSYQGDQAIYKIMDSLGVSTDFKNGGVLLKKKGTNVDHLELDFRECPDLAQTVISVAAAKKVKLSMTGLESLKIKETDRIAALKNELFKLGADLIEKDSHHWELVPPKSLNLHGLSFQTYEDHRMAMALAPLSLLTPIKIEDPDVVKKSYPNFWEHLSRIGVAVL